MENSIYMYDFFLLLKITWNRQGMGRFKACLNKKCYQTRKIKP